MIRPLFPPYFSTVFPANSVEKPVDNVDNSFYVNVTSCYRIYYVNLHLDQNHSYTTGNSIRVAAGLPFARGPTKAEISPGETARGNCHIEGFLYLILGREAAATD